nr:EamA family transporter [Tessaracoccus sp. SD287]
MGLVNVTVTFAAMFAGVAGVAGGAGGAGGATGTSAVLANAQPLLILLPVWYLYGERLSLRTSAALVVGFAGLVLVALPGGGGNGAALSVLAAAVGGAPVIAWTPRFVLSLAFLAAVGTAATTVAWFTEARRSRLDALTTWTFLTPVLGIALAAVVLGERPGGWTSVGLATVLVAMWIALRPPRRTPTPAAVTEDVPTEGES